MKQCMKNRVLSEGKGDKWHLSTFPQENGCSESRYQETYNKIRATHAIAMRNLLYLISQFVED